MSADDCQLGLASEVVLLVDKENTWSGVQDPVERRRRQARARQKSWRERKRIKNGRNTGDTEPTSSEGYGILIPTSVEELPKEPSSLYAATSLLRGHQSVKGPQSPSSVRACRESKPNKLIPPLLPYAAESIHQPTPALIFPLSADHCLITLVQYNVIRAMLLNLSITSLLDSVPQQCSRLFGLDIEPPVRPEAIPRDLQPTPLQKSTPHHFWIDAIPFPAMRDNMIRLNGTYNSADLYYDLGQALYEGLDDVERRGFIVWGEPWRSDGWEVSEGFVRKWNFLLEGCTKIAETTNRWRQFRGEDGLLIEIR